MPAKEPPKPPRPWRSWFWRLGSSVDGKPGVDGEWASSWRPTSWFWKSLAYDLDRPPKYPPLRGWPLRVIGRLSSRHGAQLQSVRPASFARRNRSCDLRL